jgi:hydrogenase nickel incorporation protein HypA/HybF
VHELGLCEAIVEAAEARSGGRRVQSLTVTVGGAHVADEAALRASMEMVAAGTAVEGAALEVRFDPVRLHCASCGAESIGTEGIGVAVCPQCHGVDVELVGGDAVVLERLELVGTGAGTSTPPGHLSEPAAAAQVTDAVPARITERSDHAH